jgi:hypothetical protein
MKFFFALFAAQCVSATVQTWVTDEVRKRGLCYVSEVAHDFVQWFGECGTYRNYDAKYGPSVAPDYTVFRKGSNVYLAFEGSDLDDFSEWFGTEGNLNCNKIAYPSFDGSAPALYDGATGFHGGLLNAYLGLRDQVYADLVSAFNACGTSCKLVIAGHSRGAVLASMAMYGIIGDANLPQTLARFHQNPLDMFVLTFGEGNHIVHNTLKNTAAWQTVESYQNRIKERHVMTGSAGTASCTVNFDPFTYGGAICNFDHTGLLVVSCNNVGGGHALGDYQWRLFNKYHVDRWFDKCWANNQESREELCSWRVRCGWGCWWEFKCDGGSWASNMNEGKVTSRIQTWLQRPCP